MITLEAADLIEGDASAATVVDYTINGVQDVADVLSIKALSDGQLANSKGTLYTTPASTTTIVKSITLVNTDSSARTVNLYVKRDGTNSRRIIPKDLSLEADGGMAILSDQLYVYPAAGGVSTTHVPHNVLDGSTHNDSVADAATRGSIIYGNATPKWDELVLGAADTVPMSDGTDLAYKTMAQLWAALSGDAAAAVDMNGQDLTNLGVVFLTEQADAETDVAGKGQVWVNTATPNELFFTDDAGTDVQLSPQGRTATLTIATGTSAAKTQLQVDSLGDSTADDVQINALIALVPT